MDVFEIAKKVVRGTKYSMNPLSDGKTSFFHCRERCGKQFGLTGKLIYAFVRINAFIKRRLKSRRVHGVDPRFEQVPRGLSPLF